LYTLTTWHNWMRSLWLLAGAMEEEEKKVCIGKYN
jgi:hypothetical protein